MLHGGLGNWDAVRKSSILGVDDSESDGSSSESDEEEEEDSSSNNHNSRNTPPSHIDDHLGLSPKSRKQVCATVFLCPLT